MTLENSKKFWTTASIFFPSGLKETRFFLLRLFKRDENHELDNFKTIFCQIHKKLLLLKLHPTGLQPSEFSIIFKKTYFIE